MPDSPRAPLVARRYSLKHSATLKDASRSFAETPGLRPGRLASKCCVICLLTKPTIADRCVYSPISSDSHCRTTWETGSGIGKSYGKSAARRAVPATIPKQSINRTGTSSSTPPLAQLNQKTRKFSVKPPADQLPIENPLQLGENNNLIRDKIFLWNLQNAPNQSRKIAL